MQSTAIRWMLATAVALCLVAPGVVPPAAANPRAPAPVKSRVLKSRAAVAKVFGKRLAGQIPATFDFALFSLVWVDMPADPDANLQIHTVPADRALPVRHSPALTVTVTRKRSQLLLQLMGDAPCSGGMAKTQQQLAACHNQLAAGLAQAKKRVHLFATPRARLSRVRAHRTWAPPRP